MSNEIQSYANDNLGIFSTFELESNEGKVAVANALNGADSLKNHIGEILPLKGVITTSGVRSTTGEVCTNNYLVLEDGTALFSQSEGVTRTLKVILGLWGKNLAAGEIINVKCLTQTLSNGHTLNTIVPA